MAPVFSWVRQWTSEQLQGTLVDIFVADDAGGVVHRIGEVEGVAGAGLAKDRYATGRGHWHRTDACQVTLVTVEDLRKADRRGGLSFADGHHRRNLVVRGIPLDALRRRKIRVGQALFAFHRPRPPCGHLDRLVQSGVAKALGKGASIGLSVIEGGVLRVGDQVLVIDDSPVSGGRCSPDGAGA